MIKLTVAIITYNEEKNIGCCLNSVKDIADDIVIVDSFSTDNTDTICKNHNVRFIQHQFDGHIEQKNWAITQAKYPHILSLDADEALSDTLKKSIIETKINWQYDGYYFNRLTNYCGKWIKHTGWYPDRKLRLWDSRKGKWKGINPHDKFKLLEGTTIKFLKGDLLHYSYNSIFDHISQVNKFTEIVARELYKKGMNTGFALLLLRPAWKFFRDFIYKLGFFDGYYGFIISVISAHATFIKHVKLREMNKDQRRNISDHTSHV